MTATGSRAPPTGHVDAIDRAGVRGWAYDPSAPRATLAIVVNGEIVGTVRCDLLRRDLQGRGDLGDACHGFDFRFPQPLSADCDQHVAVAFLCSGRGVPGSPVLLHRPSPDARLAPLLVTGAGRSGTTLLMGRLDRSPDICVARGYPFETMQLSYHAGLGRVLTAHAERDTRHDVALADGDDRVGANPFFDGRWFWQSYADPQPLAEYYLGTVPHAMRGLSMHLIEAFYGRVAAVTGKNAARFFAEKNNHLEAGPRRFARDLHADMREIVITRDPRDLFLSQRAFFRVDEERALQGVVADCATLCEMRRSAKEDTIFLRYEDLVREPRTQMARLKRFLSVACAWNDNGNEAQQFAAHGTSASAEGSIGRWRTELAPALLAAIETQCAAFLDTYGYR